MNRFGHVSIIEIEENIKKSIPKSTKDTKSSIWRQFIVFCKERNYELLASTPVTEIAMFLTDWAYNMKKVNGENYKEYTVKTMWNSTAKMVQMKYFNEFKINFNPFTDIMFKEARDAKDAKRKQLQTIPEKRKISCVAVSQPDIIKMAKLWCEETPEGLQKKFYHIAAYELAWRGGEAANCKVYHFKEETGHDGKYTNRIEYNPIFSKTTQGGSKKCMNSKWLTKNENDESVCPVILFRNLIKKRADVTTERLFLTPNPFWNKENSKGWYKNVPLGVNTISQWTKTSAARIGLDVKNNKITNHSNRASLVSHLAKAGVSDEQLIKMTGHNNSSSIKPYLQLDAEHHEKIVRNLRSDIVLPTSRTENYITRMEQSSSSTGVSLLPNKNVYNTCVFNNCTFN